MRFFVLLFVVGSLMACSKNSTVASPEGHTTAQGVPNSGLDSNIYEFKNSEQQFSIHIYPERDVWFVQKFVIAPDGFPDLTESRFFSTREKAYNHAVETYGIHESLKNPQALDAPPPSDEEIAKQGRAGGLWKAKENWTWDKEKEFAQWLRKNFRPDYFVKHNLPNDCADAYYQIRMIYARDHGLPVAFRLAGGGAWFTQNTMRPEWKNLATHADWSKDKQFLKAMQYVTNATYTHTLGRDTYPLGIGKDSIIEGTVYLQLYEQMGHTMIVSEVNLNNVDENNISRLPMYIMYSTLPVMVRPLMETFFYHGTQPEKSKIGNTGFVRFRWPKTINSASLVEAKDMPYFSEEQYDPKLMEQDELKNFSIFVFKRINPNFDPALRVTEGIVEIEELLTDRKQVVLDGYNVCKKGCVEGSADYENWSTPSRDHRLQDLSKDIYNYAMNLGTIPEVADAWYAAQKKIVLNLEGRDYIFGHAHWTFLKGFYNSDPNQIPGVRWGLDPEVFAKVAQEKMAALIDLRKQKLASNTCTPKTCPLFSKEYIKNSTFYIDGLIQSLIAEMDGYCSFSSEALCKIFKDQLQQLSSNVPGHSNLAQTWADSSIFNADPNIPASDSWGPGTAPAGAMDFTGYWQLFEASAAGTLLIYNMSNDGTTYSFKYLDLKTKSVLQELSFSSLVSFAYEKKSGQLAIFDSVSTKLSIYDPRAGLTNELAIPATPMFYASLSWYGPEKLFVASSNDLFVVEASNEKFQIAKTLNGFIHSGNMLTKATYAAPWTTTFIAVDDPNYTEWSVDCAKMAPAIELSGCHFYYRNDKLFIGSWYSLDGSQYGEFRLLTDSKTLLPMDKSITKGASYNGNTAVYQEVGKTEIWFVDKEFNALKHEKFNAECLNCYIEPFYQIGQSIYRTNLDKLKIEKVAELPANVRAMDFFDGKVIVMPYMSTSTTYSSALFSLETGKKLFEGPYIYWQTEKVNASVYPYLFVYWMKILSAGDSYSQYNYFVWIDSENPSAPPVQSSSYVSPGAGELVDADYTSLSPIAGIKLAGLSIPADQDHRPVSVIIFGRNKTRIVFRH